jgi:hypothetical protein
MSVIEDLIDGPVVDGINKTGELVERHRSVLKSSTRSLVTITLESDELLEIVRGIGKKSTLGVAVDGVFGLYKGILYYRSDQISKKEFAKYLFSEMGCGFLSSFVGNASSVTVKILTGNKPASFIVGIGTSAGTRWIYRELTPSIIPENENEDEELDEEEIEDLGKSLVRDLFDKVRK